MTRPKNSFQAEAASRRDLIQALGPTNFGVSDMKYEGSCHCGRVAFDVEGTIDQALSCNCSICSRRGSLLWFVSRDQLHLLTPEDSASSYSFNTHSIKHRYCSVCGIHLYGEGAFKRGGHLAAINIRCFENLDIATVPIHEFDGRAL